MSHSKSIFTCLLIFVELSKRKGQKAVDNVFVEDDEYSDSESDFESNRSRAGPSRTPASTMKEILDSHTGAQFLYADKEFMPVYCMAPWANPEDLRNK